MKRQCQPWQTGTARPWHRSDPPIPSSGLQRLQWIRHCQSEGGREGGEGGREEATEALSMRVGGAALAPLTLFTSSNHGSPFLAGMNALSMVSGAVNHGTTRANKAGVAGSEGST